MSRTQAVEPSSYLVVPITRVNRNHLMLAGGKGANLGELSRAGFDVPHGFIITTEAYDLFLSDNAVQSDLDGMVDSLQPDDPDSIANVSQRIQDVFQRIPNPKPIIAETSKAYAQLDYRAVAVRSSATAEDLAEAAFAGQQETFLNVIGEQQLMDAVRACWASLWSERAILYRARQKVDQKRIKLAVVVQKMVPADVAGVMFTANPVSGIRDEIVIDANPGLGEAVVGGLATPDHFVINKRSRRIKEQHIGRREVLIRAKAGGGTEHIKPTQTERDTAALPLQAVQRLSKVGVDIERHFGSPQDIEWAWIRDGTKAGKFYILQARPMTALPEPLTVSGPVKMVIPLLAEMWPTRPYPLDMSTFTGEIERAIGNLLVAMIGKSAPNPDQSFVEEDGVVLQFKPPQVHPSPGMFFTPWVTMWRTRHHDPTRWENDPIISEVLESARALEKRDLQSLTWRENIETLHEALALIPRVMNLRERYIPQTLVGLAGLWILLWIARRSKHFGSLVSGVKTRTTETNEALESLAKEIRTNDELRNLFSQNNTHKVLIALETSETGKAFIKRFERFLDEFGHRETALTISQPAWKDDPDTVLAILKVLADTERQTSDSYTEWQKARDELLLHSILGTRLLRNLFRKSLTRARYLFQIREDTHFYATLPQPTIRRVALELGKRLMQEGALAEAEDVFHLKLDELEALGETWPPADEKIVQTRSLIERRKTKRETLKNKPMIDPRLLSTMSPNQDEKDVLLRGTSGSPGIAEGPAKIVHDISEFGKLRAGDVLIAPVTNPAWTPLFQRAAAVVVDTGGPASHAAIVAREYGIPAVMGTINGTKQLQDGQCIKVDGSLGLVLKGEDEL